MSGKVGNKKDLDVLAFIEAAGIVDRMQQLAITYLVYNLKINNLWSKLQIIYPFIGGTANSHKYNLKDPRDLDIAFRITFSGTPTHNSNGISNGIINTHLNPSISCILGDTHWSLYNRINSASSFRLVEVPGSKGMQIYTSVTNLFLSDMYNDSGTLGRTSVANTNNIGFFAASKLPTPRTAIFINGILKSSNTNALIGSLPNGELTTLNVGNLAFVTMGFGLTDIENLNLYNIIQQYQLILNRQV